MCNLLFSMVFWHIYLQTKHNLPLMARVILMYYLVLSHLDCTGVFLSRLQQKIIDRLHRQLN